MELIGQLIVKKEKVQVSDKFAKREFVIKEDGQYPQEILFQCVQDKCSLIDLFNEGETVKVTFAIQGKRHDKDGKSNWFNNLNAYKLDKVGESF